MSLNAIANPADREPGPRVIFVRCRTVAKVDSIGFVTGMKDHGAAVPSASSPLVEWGVVGLRCDRPGQGRRE
jgi:hypothetical protein